MTTKHVVRACGQHIQLWSYRGLVVTIASREEALERRRRPGLEDGVGEGDRRESSGFGKWGESERVGKSAVTA